MNKHELQYRIRSNELRDTNNANDWLSENGWDTSIFATTHVRLLQAQQQAHTLLTQYSNLLTEQQRKTLQEFQHKMQTKHIRCKLKPNAANAVLNISSKINRQLFKQHRKMSNI
jgi:hypothetical protein